MEKITPFLWYNGNVEDVVKFYTSVFKNSEVNNVSSGYAVIKLNGQELFLFNGGPMFEFTEAISLYINCDTQEQIDYYWDNLTADGGKESRCGWLKDKFGLTWQVIPSILQKLIWNEDKEKANRAMQAMLKMGKLDIKELQDALTDKFTFHQP